jgi:hypothetical protein
MLSANREHFTLMEEIKVISTPPGLYGNNKSSDGNS